MTGDWGTFDLRVLVKGGSSAVAVVPRPAAVHAATFARWTEVLLKHAGWDAKVWDTSEEGHLVKDAACKWHRSEYVWNPDVVVLNLGQYECTHAFLPQRLERFANDGHAHPGTLRRWGRDRVVRPFWRRAARAQRAMDRRRQPLRERRLARTAAELDALISAMLVNTRRLVLVVDYWPPTEPWTSWFPGMARRVERIHELVAADIEMRGDPNVRLVSVRDLVTAAPLATTMPDGVHYSAQVHRQLAEALVEEITAWALAQPASTWDVQSSTSGDERA